jgi:hypothetical protein
LQPSLFEVKEKDRKDRTVKSRMQINDIATVCARRNIIRSSAKFSARLVPLKPRSGIVSTGDAGQYASLSGFIDLGFNA